jgi:hypothetical protein
MAISYKYAKISDEKVTMSGEFHSLSDCFVSAWIEADRMGRNLQTFYYNVLFGNVVGFFESMDGAIIVFWEGVPDVK